MSTLSLIGMGSNLGDRKAHLDLALAGLANTPGVTVRAVSTFHETAPVGGPGGQGAFLNAAAALETALEPERLLDRLNAIEQQAGRVRTARWGERTLDLDLLLHGSSLIDAPRLRVPHPRLAFRRFVLAPLAEIAPKAVDPVTGRTIGQLLANLDRRPSYLAFATKTLAIPREPEAPSRDENLLYHELIRLLDAVPIESIGTKPFADPIDRPRRSGLSSANPGSPIDLLIHRLDSASWTPERWGDRWLVSPFWFDALYLWLTKSETSPPRSPGAGRRFLEARGRVLSPTFVIARPGDHKQLGLDNPQLSWRHPVGRETPILTVHDFESQADLAEILTTCAATRAG